MNYTKLSHEKLDLNLINNLVVHESCGAVSFFCGTTRDYFEDKTVVSLKYEAYETMALKSMNEICEKLREQWPNIKNIAIYHRLGTVPVKESSVIIGISSPHRETSLLAIRYAIDELKRMVPIWKLEKYSNPNYQSEWKENSECSWSSKHKNDDHTNINNAENPLNFDECPIADEIPIPKMLVQINADSNELKRRLNCFIQGKRKEIDINNRKDFIEKPQTTSNQMIKSEEFNDAHDDVDDDDNDEYEDDNEQYTNNFSCARVNSSVFKNINTKSHLKVHRVKNEYGPQTKHDYTETLDKLMNTTANKMMVNIKQEPLVKSPLKSIAAIPQIESKNGVIERIKNAESYLKLSNINNNAVSPTPIPKDIYKRLKDIETRILHLETVSPEYTNFLPRAYHDNSIRKKKKKMYTIDELDNYIQELQRKNI